MTDQEQFERGAVTALLVIVAVAIASAVVLLVLGAILTTILVGAVLLAALWAIAGLALHLYNRTRPPERRIVVRRRPRS
jgi:hypothetical protein